jgi:hypothetical protein
MPKILSRKIYFAIPNQRWGTYFLRGVQIQRHLRKIGVDARVIATKNIATVSNAIIVFVKHIDKASCTQAKNNANICVYDILDGYSNDLAFLTDPDLLDGLIFSTNASRTHLSLPGSIPHKTIYHHIDPRLEKSFKPDRQAREFKLCYIGNLPEKTDNVAYTNLIPALTMIETDTRHAQRNQWMRKISPYTCHYGVRVDAVQRFAKPLAKVGVAAVCNANLIINRASAACELLGDDYPFLTGETVESVMSAIEYAKTSFGGAPWQQGLEKMRLLKQQLSITTIVNQYVDLFRLWE